MSTYEQEWALVLAGIGRPAVGKDRDAVLGTAMALGLGVVPDTVGCSVTELTDSGFRTSVSANEMAVDLDHGQYAAGEGPCLAAADSGRPEQLDAADHQSRYPDFAAAAARLGVRSSLSLPLVGLPRPAAFNLYASAAAAYRPDRARAVAGLLARCVAALLHGGPVAVPAAAPDLAAALAQGRLIGRAGQVLMARDRVGAPEAFARMALRSKAEMRSIVDVALELAPDGAR